MGLAGVVCESSDDSRARALAECLGAAFLVHSPDHGLVLAQTPERLELRDTGRPALRPVFVDFGAPETAARIQAGRHSTLARALGLHRRPKQSVIDASCGLGRDAAVLLGLGCPVWACERSPVIAALIEDGLARAPEALRRHWQGLRASDARDWLAGPDAPMADIVYIDPMFQPRGRRALPKRDMQLLHALLGPDDDAAELLAAGRERAKRRVVVKRHPRNPPLAPPDRELGGRGLRFDIYLRTL